MMETAGKKNDGSSQGMLNSSGSKLVQLARSGGTSSNGHSQLSPSNGKSTQPATGPLSSITSPNVEIHPLHYTWVFWFMHRPPGQKILSYESGMKRIAAFSSVEDFWAVYSHLRRPSDLPTISDYHLFKQGVRPVWEDEVNINGGKWIIRIKKGLANRYWESLVLAIVGDQFEVGDEICGAVLSIRFSEDIISIWNRTANNPENNLKIRDTLKAVLDLPSDTIIGYKTHNDALKDNSSFRNTDLYK